MLEAAPLIQTEDQYGQVLLNCSKRWTNVSAHGGFKGRAAHSATALDDKSILIFGGWCQKEGKISCFDDVWLFDALQRRWTEVVLAADSDKPEARGGHAAGGWPGHVIVYGGESERRQLRDCWLLRIDQSRWHRVQASGRQPGPRLGCCGLVMVHSCLVLGDCRTSDVAQLDLATACWKSCRGDGEVPDAREFYQVAQCNATSFVVCGGRPHPEQQDMSMFLADILVPMPSDTDDSDDILTIRWSRVISQGSPPVDRFGCGLVALTGSYMVIFGGTSKRGQEEDAYVCLLDRSVDCKATWAQVNDSGDSQPTKRDGFVMVGLPDSSGIGTRIFLSGGGVWNDNLYHSDTWVFDINIHDDVKKAISDSQGAFVKRVVGVVRLLFEDVIQGVLQILFLAEFWQKLHWTSRAFTISSVVAGLACSAGGPVNEYIAELRHREDQRRLQQSVERLRAETTLQSSWKKEAIC
ncbi:unnamed protein product [Symbiodinium sp. CCMP2456]|nr:unnamed protein product [Symbiodinium sp. CCMP2456]